MTDERELLSRITAMEEHFIQKVIGLETKIRI